MMHATLESKKREMAMGIDKTC